MTPARLAELAPHGNRDLFWISDDEAQRFVDRYKVQCVNVRYYDHLGKGYVYSYQVEHACGHSEVHEVLGGVLDKYPNSTLISFVKACHEHVLVFCSRCHYRR